MEEMLDKIKGGATKLFGRASKAAKQVAEKTDTVMTQTKISFAISETKNKMEEIYTDIGKKVYQKHLEGTDFCDCMTEALEKLDELNEELEALNERLSEAKSVIKCKSCGENNPKNSSFCANCGESLRDDYEENDEETDDEVIIIKPKKTAVEELGE